MDTAQAPAPPAGVGHAPEFWTWNEGARTTQARRAVAARNVSGRRRSVDPTTCEREYSPAEWEFIGAMHAYKQRSGRQFPTWGEALGVLRGLGYEKADG